MQKPVIVKEGVTKITQLLNFQTQIQMAHKNSPAVQAGLQLQSKPRFLVHSAHAAHSGIWHSWFLIVFYF